MMRSSSLHLARQCILPLALTSLYFSCDSIKEKVGVEYNTTPITVSNFHMRGINAPVIIDPFHKAIVVRYQKIVVLTDKELQNSNGQTLPVSVDGKKVDAKIIRVSEYPNPTEEYGGITYTVLLEFEEKIVKKDLFSRISLAGAQAQASNFVIMSGEMDDGGPNNPPPHPPWTSNFGEIIKVYDSDFRTARLDDVNQYSRQDKLIVAMIDTGVKFNFIDSPGHPPFQYTDNNGKWRTLKLSVGNSSSKSGNSNLGYCGITEYLRASADSDPEDDQLYRNKSELSALRKYKRQDILNSAFDDHLVLTSKNVIMGRHGSFITSIINQDTDDVAVLPVKALNYAGNGTLYDMLCCLNYVLAQKRSGLPIQILNASWVGSLSGEGLDLLKSKFAQLEQAGILVVAAAGNDHQNLSQNKLYPACFSKEFNNVITVTSLRKSSSIVDQLRNVSGGYEASLNYSNEFVSIGVYGGRGPDDSMQGPFLNKAGSTINGTSFAAAHVSGLAARYLSEHPVTLSGANIAETKERIVNELTKVDQGLASEVAGGRFLQVN